MLASAPRLATLAVRGGGPPDTAEAIEQRLAVLEGGSAAVGAPAGLSLLLAALRPLMRPGDQLVAAQELSVPGHQNFAQALAGLGWEVLTAPLDDSAAFERAIGPKTQALLVPSVAMSGAVADVAAFAALAKRAHVPLLVDNTVPTPALSRPVTVGADIVVHLDTRFLCGEALGVGFIVDAGQFSWQTGRRYPAVTERGAIADGDADTAVIGNFAYASACRSILGDGTRFDIAKAAAGIESVELRMRRQAESARMVAEYLAGHRHVVALSYAGLPGDRHHNLAVRYCPDGPGALLRFWLEGGPDEARALIERLELVLPAAERTAVTTIALVADDTEAVLALSVGLEAAADIIADLEQALEPPGS